MSDVTPQMERKIAEGEYYDELAANSSLMFNGIEDGASFYREQDNRVLV